MVYFHDLHKNKRISLNEEYHQLFLYKKFSCCMSKFRIKTEERRSIALGCMCVICGHVLCGLSYENKITSDVICVIMNWTIMIMEMCPLINIMYAKILINTFLI